MLSYTKSIIPLISLSSLFLALSIFSLFMLMSDLFQKGCLAWHRDSIGLLIQRIVFSVCMLFSSIYLYNYVSQHENTQKHEGKLLTFEKIKQMSILTCFSDLTRSNSTWVLNAHACFSGSLRVKGIFYIHF